MNIIIIVCHNMQLRSFLRRIKPYPCLRANSFNYECNEVVQKIPWNGKFFSLVTDIPHSQIFAHDVEGIDLSDSSIHKQSSTNNYKHLFISLKTFVNCLDSLFWLNFLNVTLKWLSFTLLETVYASLHFWHKSKTYTPENTSYMYMYVYVYQSIWIQVGLTNLYWMTSFSTVNFARRRIASLQKPYVYS